MARVHAELIPVHPQTKAPMPSIAHNGSSFVVAEPGTELWVHIINPQEKQSYRAHVAIDGQSIGYRKTSTALSSHKPLEMEFAGFTRTNRDGAICYTAFKFSALKPAAGASTVEHPDQIAAGRIEVRVEAVVQVGTRTRSGAPDVQWGNDVSNKKLPEGKKWFLQPGLKAEVGSTVTKDSKGWGTAWYCSMFDLPVLKLRYDTAENLMLRKILDPTKPAHRAILSASNDPRIAALGRRQSAGGSRQTTIKPERHVAGVKRERGQQRDQQQWENDDDFVVPRSATAETINLIEDTAAPVQPLTLNGRALAADEMAVCDLLDSDDEPDWKVTKKEGTGVVEV